MDALFKTEFHERFKTGNKISVTLKKYDADKTPYITFRMEEADITKTYEIGSTNLDTAQGQVELLYGTNKSMIVEYQWFNEALTKRKITKIV